MNILHINRFSGNGQTMHVFSLVREQVQQGVNARLLMDGYPSYQALNSYKPVLLELEATLIKAGDVDAAKVQLEGSACQLVHAHSSLSYPLAAELAELLSIPLVLSCHRSGPKKQEHKPYLEQAKALICDSHKTAASFKEFADKVHIIPTGVNLKACTPGTKGEPLKIVLIPAEDNPRHKGYGHFCKAVDLVEGVEFYVVSKKELPTKTGRYVHGSRKVSALLKQTDIVAATDEAAIEGLACGNALIVLGRTYQGILAPEKVSSNKPADLSGLSGSTHCYRNMFYDLAKLTQNSLYLQQLQKFSRQLAQSHYDNSILTKRLIATYQSTL